MSVVPGPPQVSEPVSTAPADSEDLFGVRIAAALIDLALLVGLLVVLTALIGNVSVGDRFSFYLNDYADVALFVGLVLLYYFALEATIGQTVGKLLVGLRVVGADGGRASVAAVAIRTVVRVVDWLPLLYLVGFLAMLATGSRRQRLGDVAAGTGIARAVPARHRGVLAAAVSSGLVVVVAGSFVYVAATGEGKTCLGQGVSLDYRPEWEKAKTQAQASSGPTEELWNAAGIAGRFGLAGVAAYRLNVVVVAGNPSPCR